MKYFTHYLKENCSLLLFYVCLMAFILMVTYLDRHNRLLDSNILYLTLVSLFMFTVYLLLDFRIKYNYLKKLIILKSSKDKTPILPLPLEYKDEIYSSIIFDLYNSYTLSLKNIEDNVMENSEFMTSWVHEIKTPITTLKLIAADTDDVQTNKVDNKYLASIKEEIDKIDEYVEKVLYYSRSGDFSKDYIISEISLNALVKESVKKHSIIFIRQHIHFVNKIAEGFSVDSDKKWLLFIIDQLISNALKYTNTEGTIKISSLEDEKEKILIISDNGIGIKKEDIKRIFTKFFTGNNGRNINKKATGMGLYLSQKLSKKLGHYITIESEYGNGTSVYVHFVKWDA